MAKRDADMRARLEERLKILYLNPQIYRGSE